MKSTAVLLGALLFAVGNAWAQTTIAEPQITKLMKVANEGEIDAAKLAKKKAENPKVKEFAKKMMDEHEKNEKEIKKIAKKTDIGMDKSEESKNLDEHAEDVVKNLKDKKGAEFDKAYMASQVEMHQSLLDKIEKDFIPSAQRQELKDYLAKTRDHVKMHLDEAKAIQATLQ